MKPEIASRLSKLMESSPCLVSSSELAFESIGAKVREERLLELQRKLDARQRELEDVQVRGESSFGRIGNPDLLIRLLPHR